MSVLGRSVYQPTQWTVANVARLSVLHLGGKRLVTADHTHSCWYNVSPLSLSTLPSPTCPPLYHPIAKALWKYNFTFILKAHRATLCFKTHSSVCQIKCIDYNIKDPHQTTRYSLVSFNWCVYVCVCEDSQAICLYVHVFTTFPVKLIVGTFAKQLFYQLGPFCQLVLTCFNKIYC